MLQNIIIYASQLFCFIAGISLSHLTYSPDLDVKVAESCVTLTLPADRTGVHTFQYRKKPLTRERPVYQVNITSLSKSISGNKLFSIGKMLNQWFQTWKVITS